VASAGLVIGILIIPLVSSMSEDALSAVPRALREASYGLGATKLETAIKVILPARYRASQRRSSWRSPEPSRDHGCGHRSGAGPRNFTDWAMPSAV